MSSSKSALAFVGKSVAFALISGIVWCLIIVFVMNYSGRTQSSASSASEPAQLTRQIETYDKQASEAQDQLNRNIELQERSAKLLDTQEKLFAEQERLQRRFSAILDKWEKMPTK